MNRLLGLALLLAAVGGAWWWHERSAPPPGWQGYVEADYIKVGPTLQGRLVGVPVARGDAVAAGAVLFAQDPAEDAAARDQAAAALAQAMAQLANLQAPGRDTEIAQAEADLAVNVALLARAEHDRARAEALVRTNATSRQQLDLALADAASAAARVDGARAKLAQMRAPTGRAGEIAAQRAAVATARAVLAQAEWRLAQRQGVAPLAGSIAETYALPGETLAAGAPVVSLLAPAHTFVRFFVPEAALAAVHLGAQVAVACDTCPADLRAGISFVSPAAEYTPPVIYSDASRGKLVWLIEARPEGPAAVALKPGQPVTVRPLPP